MTALYVAWAVSAGVLVVAAAALGASVGRGYAGILIDSRGRYSLTHFQIVLWTIVVISLLAGVFVARLLADAESALEFAIPGELLAVLGISAGSTVVATIVKSEKDSSRPESVAATNGARKPSPKQLFTIEEGALADRAIDVTKFQKFWFTFVVVGAYVALCAGSFADLEEVSQLTSLPGFDANVVTLLGISHAAYVAGKLPSRAGRPDAPTAVPLSERALRTPAGGAPGAGRESAGREAAPARPHPSEAAVETAHAGVPTTGPARAVTEAITIDPDYANRRGYDAAFLGEDAQVPLPQLDERLIALAAVKSDGGPEPHVLPYHHFSVVLNKQRRLAFFTAVNIDGAVSYGIKRGADRWFFDPRVPRTEQTGEAVYRDNPLDRGHLVRRLDPAWGPTPAVAKVCSDDTFHFTNCTPQHEDFNQSQTTWAGLEDYILENADNRDLKVSVFTGPVLADDDDAYRGVRLPRQYWKVVAMVKASGELSATAYLLSQEHLIRGLELVREEFSYGAYKTFQVEVRRIEALTGLSFGSLAAADPLARLEAAAVRQVERLEQLVL